jgi:hypothetical protein
VLHIDDQHGRALAEADALPHALFAVNLGGRCFGIGHDHHSLDCRRRGRDHFPI